MAEAQGAGSIALHSLPVGAFQLYTENKSPTKTCMLFMCVVEVGNTHAGRDTGQWSCWNLSLYLLHVPFMPPFLPLPSWP